MACFVDLGCLEKCSFSVVLLENSRKRHCMAWFSINSCKISPLWAHFQTSCCCVIAVLNSFKVVKQVKRSFLRENKCMQRWKPQKTTKLDGNDTTTLSHHPYILCHFTTICTNMLCVCCVQKRVVEGSEWSQ